MEVLLSGEQSPTESDRYGTAEMPKYDECRLQGDDWTDLTGSRRNPGRRLVDFCRCHAAVYRQCGPGNSSRIAGCQEYTGVRDIPGLNQAG